MEVSPLSREPSSTSAAEFPSGQARAEHDLSLFEGGEAAEVAKELSDEQLVQTLEAMLGEMWGGMGLHDAERFRAVAGEWLQRDESGCISWALGQGDERRREAALLAVIDQLGQSDPVKAIHLYCEIERITLDLLCHFQTENWKAAILEMAVSQPRELAVLLQRFPEAPSYERSGFEASNLVEFDVPEGFDFTGFLGHSADSVRADIPQPHMEVAILEEWAKRDVNASWQFVEESFRAGQVVKWGTVLRQMENSGGAELVYSQAAELLASLPAKKIPAALASSYRWKEILDSVPDKETRLHYLSQLSRWDFSGIKDPFGDTWREYASHAGWDLEETTAELQARQGRVIE
ncbi:MAG: hypothetical protein Q7Q71_01765 [Verrucomicrobiota bacterium JB023]|nr:hypothetical protein [Verrucomicrobiota bacterium JB023]